MTQVVKIHQPSAENIQIIGKRLETSTQQKKKKREENDTQLQPFGFPKLDSKNRPAHKGLA